MLFYEASAFIHPLNATRLFLKPFLSWKFHVHFSEWTAAFCFIFYFIFTHKSKQMCFPNHNWSIEILFSCNLPFPIVRHKKAFLFSASSREKREVKGKCEYGDVELIINFVIPSHFHRLLSAFEYFKHYLISSLCPLCYVALHFRIHSKFNKSNNEENSDENSN